MKNIILLVIFLIGTAHIHAQNPEDTEDWSRKPLVVSPDKIGKTPSDAIILFNKKTDINNWVGNKEEVKWLVKSNSFYVKNSKGAIKTKQSFGDMQLHIEWKSPKKIEGQGQGRGNSGVFLMGKYEIQVLDSYENETYYNGQAASIYKQHIPLVNACRKPGKWQSYDIIFTAPVFSDDKKLVSPAYVTLIHNGILVQNHVELKGGTAYIGQPKYTYHNKKLPITLQNHGNPVGYRNIWVREL